MASKSLPLTERIKNSLGEYSDSLKLLFPILIYKCFIFIFIILTFLLLPEIFSYSNFARHFHWPLDAAPDMSSVFKTWDGQHFLFLSRMGYVKDSISIAFNPLWPGLIWLFSHVMGGSHLVSGLILSNLFSCLGLVLFHYLACKSSGKSIADNALLLLLAYPGALFFSFVYSEALFFFLAMLFFIFLMRAQYGLVAITAFLLVLTRQVGIFFLFPLIWELVVRKESPKKWLACIGPFMGLAVYFLIIYLATGDPLAGHKAQSFYPAHASISKVFDFAGFFKSFFHSPLTAHGAFSSAIDRLWFVWFAVSLFFVFRRSKTYFIYALVMGLVPAMTHFFMSYTRYALMVFPLFIITAEFLTKESRKIWLWLTLAVLFSIQIVFLIRHINNFWVG